MLRLGANIYFVAKLIIPQGISVQDAGAAFQGITTEEFKAKLTDKGIDLEQRLIKEGGYWNGLNKPIIGNVFLMAMSQ